MVDGQQAVDGVGEITVTRTETVNASRIIVRISGRPRPVFDAVVHDVLDTPELVELLSAYVSAHCADLRVVASAPQSVAPTPLVPAHDRPRALRLLP